jgi:Flp pilus assembly pilin Flp
MKTLARFFRDDKGLELVEYAVMAALIVATLITAIVGLSAAIQGKFGALTTTITTH